MASPGTDIAFNVDRTEGYRAFANKIWNAARFLFMNVDRAAELGIVVDPKLLGGMPTVDEKAPLEARWIVAEFYRTANKVNESLENYRYDDAANTIYQFFWGSFCDWYLEIVKLSLDFPLDFQIAGPGAESPAEQAAKSPARKAALTTLVSVFEASLRLLSPFMPFITEEIWHALYDGNPPAKSIALTRYPQATDALDEFESGLRDASLNQMKQLQRVITSIRALRKEVGVPDREHVGTVYFHSNSGESVEGARPLMAALLDPDIVRSLARVSEVVDSGPLTQRHIHSESNFDVGFDYEATIDVPAERERLNKDIAKYEKGLASAEHQLGNESFLGKAPPQVVEGLKKQEAETRLLLEKARGALDALPGA